MRRRHIHDKGRKAVGKYFNTFHMYCENDVIERLKRLQEKLACKELIFKFDGNKYAIFPMDQFDRKPITDYIFSLEEIENFVENM